MEWYVKVLKNYANFSGRARRKEYWMFVLFNFLISWSFLLIDLAVVLTTSEKFYLGTTLWVLYTLAVFLPGLGVTVRRLHDTNRSGWWFFIALVPLVGGFIFLYFMLQDGSTEENDYGVNPKLEEAIA